MFKVKVYLLYSMHSVPRLLCVRTAHAQGKAEAAVGAAQKAQEESRMARVTAKQFSPSFQHPGNGGHTHSPRSQHTYIRIYPYAAHVHNPQTQPSRHIAYATTHVRTHAWTNKTHTRVCVWVGDKGQCKPPSSFAFLPLSLTPVQHRR